MNNETSKLINNLKNVPAMPNVVIQALNIVKDPNSSIKDLGDIISYDQSLSLKVLNLVNSAYYGFAQQITSITRALALLGMNQAKNIIVAVAMKPMFSSEENKELWKHSITAAVGCEYIAQYLNIMDSEEAFVIGFLHDIGKIILNMQDKTICNKIKELVANGSDIIEAERMFFGTDHAEVGAELAKKWQLPILLTNVIKYHHTPNLASVPKECSLVYLVDKLIQDNFNGEVNLDYVKNLNLKLDQPSILRDSILRKADILISELSS